MLHLSSSHLFCAWLGRCLLRSWPTAGHPTSVPPGDYDTYVRTRAELEENQMKKYKWEQEQVGCEGGGL